MFRESAQALVDKIGAVDAVAASLAHISGTKEIKLRSLLSGREVGIKICIVVVLQNTVPK